MAEKLIKFSGLLLFIVLLHTPLYSAADPAESAFRALQKSSAAKDKNNFVEDGNLFLKKFPGSSRIPDVRLLLADKESDTELAIEKYRSIIKNYSRFKGREKALYKICQILDLKSKWKDLLTESANGIKLFPEGIYINDFKFMHIAASLMLDKYDTARDESIEITEHTHGFEILSRAIFLLAETEKKIGGNSKPYIFNLKELAVGFRKSEIYPSIIFQLGVFYDEKKDYDRAYSAFNDIAELFPDSPEADMSLVRIDKLKKLNPKKISYIADNLTVKNTDDLDLSPEQDIKIENNNNYYSVAIGPFSKLKDTSGVLKLLKNYDKIRNIKTAYGYMIYLGKYNDTDNALEIRIRLAEEFGINGNIVKISVHDKKSYIYEDR